MMVLKSAALTLLAAYVLLVGALYLFQGNLLHLPSGSLISTPDSVGLAYEDVYLETEDGETLHSWWLPAPDAQGTVLFFHGNAGNISYRLDSLRIFHNLGQNVLIVGYRGYGNSTGSPSEQGLYQDAEAGLAWLQAEQGISAAETVVFGRSLGAAVAAHLAKDHTVAGLIVESGFTSAPDMAANLYPFVPARTLLRFDYNTLAYVSAVQSPVLVVHSPDDEIIPFSHGRALYNAAPEPKYFLQLEGDHNQGFLLTGERYRDGLRDFFTIVLEP